jgi:hypothetical protein
MSYLVTTLKRRPSPSNSSLSSNSSSDRRAGITIPAIKFGMFLHRRVQSNIVVVVNGVVIIEFQWEMFHRINFIFAQHRQSIR